MYGSVEIYDDLFGVHHGVIRARKCGRWDCPVCGAFKLLCCTRKRKKSEILLQTSGIVLDENTTETESKEQNELGEIKKILMNYFPAIRILHPQPMHRFDAITRGRSPVR